MPPRRSQVDVIYRTPYHNHNAIEPHAATLAWDGDELTVHDCAQGVAHIGLVACGQSSGSSEEQVHVIVALRRRRVRRQDAVAASDPRRPRRRSSPGGPVRIALSREGVYRVVGGRARTEQRVAIGAQADGRFDALIHTGTVAMTGHNNLPEPFITPATCLYAAGSMKLDVQVADLDMLANTFMRAPGEAVGSFALECAIDELAERHRHRPDRAADPQRAGRGSHVRQALLLAPPGRGVPDGGRAVRLGQPRLAARRAPRGRVADRHGLRHRDLSLSTASPAAPRGSHLPGTAHATVEIAAHEMGMGTATVQTQVTAERLGLPLEQVTVAYGDSSFPGVIARRRIAADRLDRRRGRSPRTARWWPSCSGSRRRLAAGRAQPGRGRRASTAACASSTNPDDGESYASILGRARPRRGERRGQRAAAVETANWSMHSFGAQFCEVRVNAVTGETRVSRFLGSFDCGRILNPKTAASQFRGGIIMGLGLALMEETQFDERNGRIMNPSLAEYHVPVHMDVPEIDVIWTDIPDPHTPMGAHGIGEIGITGVGAAVANAIYNATGTRVRDLPITLDKLLYPEVPS